MTLGGGGTEKDLGTCATQVWVFQTVGTVLLTCAVVVCIVCAVDMLSDVCVLVDTILVSVSFKSSTVPSGSEVELGLTVHLRSF
mmetsp:Transcript_28174/g.34424  ORF Transcript_28174/g.34424 Transcript_28174/m.34424 type:complete len:84 (-) Transcript_28174:431-682(-)